MKAICQLCDSDRSRLAFVKNGYAHFACCDCGSLYVYPRPSSAELLEFYRLEQGNHLSQSCWQESHKHSWDLWKHTLQVARNKAGSGRLLDIGCGSGEFLRFAQKMGWSDVEGIEVIPEIADIAGQLTGAKIYTSDFLETPLAENSYAVITLWDVIEHLSNVPMVLERIFSLLKPGGIVIIGTVNQQGISMRFFKEKSLTVMPPEHLTFFTSKGMRQALKNQHFIGIMCWSCMIYLREWTRFLSRTTSNNTGDIKDYANVRSTLTDSSLFLQLIRVTNVGLKITNLGDELVATAQKGKL
ncbi:MAG: class I SAM-dependent methyltransferase [Microcystis aeruginosa PMC 728.11]|jgi:2-polyprenyl-3-methyl-5-hydroxy-6-metoxy-1,4-benzoquinol methylase|nr:class I SAM-dependent methyltransferase [Microcystis aeruginosa PMC 728.11]